MKAVTVAPGTAGSVRLAEVPESDASLGSVVEALADRQSDKHLHVNGCAARDSNPEPAD